MDSILYYVERVSPGLWQVVDPDENGSGILARFTTKWEATDYAAEMNRQDHRISQHGGARSGAGRKPLADESTVECTISLPASLDAKAKRLGDGNRSAGIRKALEAFTGS